MRIADCGLRIGHASHRVDDGRRAHNPQVQSAIRNPPSAIDDVDATRLRLSIGSL
jgi:hypothetical protein